MNLPELADLGVGLAEELEQAANRIYFKDYRYDQLVTFADDIRDKAQEVLNLLSNPRVVARLESSSLLSQATQLPDLASTEERAEHFERLADAALDFAHTEQSWEVNFAANHQKYTDLWEKPKQWEQQFQEDQRKAAEAARRQLAENAKSLALVQEKLSKPAREAPCFAEARKNGLNCNRGDLVEIKKLPSVFSPPKKIEVAIKRCSQCWQIYKEYFEVDESTKQFRSRFLKPDEMDAAHGYHFSMAEAEAYNGIDFRAFLDPSLKNQNLKIAATSTSAPTDSPIAVGKLHRTLCDVTMIVYEYESGVETVVLPAGSLFQPWEPEHRRGVEVPITLGDRATEFDWGVTASLGHFLKWDDFFSKCGISEGHGDAPAQSTLATV